MHGVQVCRLVEDIEKQCLLIFEFEYFLEGKKELMFFYII